MKALSILSQHFYPSHASTAQLLTDLALGLAKEDFHIQIFTSSPQADAPALISSNLTLHRFPLPLLKSHSILGKAFASLFFLLLGFVHVIRLPKTTPLIIASNPPYAGLLGLCFKCFKGGQYIFLFQDIFPESAVLSGVLKPYSLLYKSFDRLMLLICHQAQRTIVLTPAMQAYMSSKNPTLKNQLRVIENWSIEAISPLPKADNPFARQHGLDKVFTVLYSGNIGRLHDIATIVEAINLLRCQPIQFVFIGDGPKQTILRDYLEKHQLSNLTLLPFQPRHKLPHTLTACDLSLVSLIPGAETIVAPCKLYGMLAAGRPILSISASGSYLDQLLTQHACGINISSGDSQALAHTIQMLASQPERVVGMGQNARQLYKERFQLERAIKEYKKIICDL